jgi:hypothetical protein
VAEVFRRFVGLAGLAVAFVIAGCASRQPPLANDAYVWQRQWTPALARSIADSGNELRAWRVLAAEMDGRGQWRTFSPAWPVLAASGKPVIAVVRLEGALQQWDETVLLERTRALLSQWRLQGIRYAGIEIDHDCATSRLPAYTHFLASLRPLLAPGERLSITALPTWLESPGLDALLAQADETVLQVHAVQSPRAGLFQPERARAWLREFARHTGKPWRVALPAYGTRVSWDDQGRVVAIESERPTLVDSTESRELFAEPAAMQRFVAGLEADVPHGLAGIVWFRLPTEGDERAWSMASWHAVLRRTPLTSSITVHTVPSGDPSRLDVQIVNSGTSDMALPALVRIDSACEAADGINGYALQRTPQGLYLQRTRVGLLRAGRQLAIGWLRCSRSPGTVRIDS